MFGFNKSDSRLIFNFFKLALRDRYLGSGLGSLWAIANPLLMMGIYTFVFAFIFNVRFPGANSTLSYTAWLISGYGPWLAINEAIMAATFSIVASSGLIKNLAFKTEILPVAHSLIAIVPLMVSLIFLCALLVIDGNFVTWHIISVIPVIMLQFFFIISLGFFLATITVFVRDVGIVLPNILMIILFLSPIFYPIENLPKMAQMISKANPFYILSEGYRQPLIHHHLPNVYGLLYLFVVTLIFTYAGLKMFRRAKGHFTSML